MAGPKNTLLKNRSGSSSYDELPIHDDDKYKKGKKNAIPWFRLTVASIIILGCLYFAYPIFTLQGKKAQRLDEFRNTDTIESMGADNDESSKTYFWKTLPSSDVWCRGEKRLDRMCRIRNLCYHPKHKEWFVLKTSNSVMQYVPFNETEYLFIELNTVEGHNKFYWRFSEVSPYNPKFKNVNMRYETKTHFLFSRLHPNNIMHNLHDDVLGLFFTLKEYAAATQDGKYFGRNHRLLIMDEFGETDSSRPFHYFTDYPLRFRKYVESVETITCFKDAVLGNNKIATFYQYGFFTPQSKIPNKELNGIYVRDVAKTILQRLGIRDAFDENEVEFPPVQLESEIFGTKNSPMDLKETDLIIILIRKKNRLILNQDDLLSKLKMKYGLEVILVSNEDHPFEEQIKYLRRARVVIGMHGSIMVMTMFCRRGTVVLELFPFAVPSNNYTPYKTLAELPKMDLIYRSWENKDEQSTVVHPNREPLGGGIAHLPKEEQDKIISTKTVPEHLCCSSPFWLYRIYQDTKVNLKEITDTIDEALFFSRRTVLKNIYETNYFEASFIKPAAINVGECLQDPRRKPDQLWMSWKAPWNEAPVTQYNLQVNGNEYVTRGNATSIVVSGLTPNTTAKVSIRPLAPGYKGYWGNLIYCKI